MLVMEHNAAKHGSPIPTWFGVGGGADALARPANAVELISLVREHAGKPIRILGDGANLLVDDAGVDGLVLSLDRLNAIERLDAGAAGAEDTGGAALLRVGAGANLPRLIVDSVRQGLGGLEGLAGVPATVGGAIAMNAGGAFGQIADVIERVRVFSHTGDDRWLERRDIAFGYRTSGLAGSIVVEAEIRLSRTEGAASDALRARLKDVMAKKKASQPMSERSAGCFWKNPPAPANWPGHRSPDGSRIGAGWLVDQAGLKGLRVGGASVSDVHANFVVSDHNADGTPRCAAGDVLALMRMVRERVQQRWSITLEPEVVIWRRGEWDARTGGRASL